MLSLEKLNADLKSVEADLVEAKEKQDKSSGAEKSVATKTVKTLMDKKAEIEKSITEAKAGLDKDGPKKLEDIEDGEMVVVKNLGNFMLHNKDDRFPPGIEKRTEMRGFVRSQINSGTFGLLDK